jgi:hypothetical protein
MVATSMRTRQAPQSLLKPMGAVLRLGLLLGAVGIPLAMGIGYVVAGMPGLWGGRLGFGISLVFFTLTAVVAIATARLQPQWLGLAVMVSWLVKLVALVVILIVLDGQDFYSRGVFFGALLISTFGYLAMEAIIVARTRVLYVETEFAPDSEPRS